jgi:hypothetical protein
MDPSPETRSQLKKIYRWGLGIRLSLAVLLHFTTNDSTFAPDQETYHLWSIDLSNYWVGDSLFYPARLLLPGEPIGYFWIVASIYTLFGAWSLLPKLLNGFVGAFTIKLVFDLALRVCGDERVALRAATYSAFFPSLVLWSVLNIRDCWAVFLIVLICRQALQVQDRLSIVSLALLGLAVFALTKFRAYILFAVTLPILVSFVVRQRAHLVRNAALGMLMAAAVIYADASAGRARRMRFIDFEELDRSRRWSSTAAESGFARGVDISTPEKALLFLPVGLTYFLLAPFPWTVGSLRQAITVPEMLFFYSLLPALVRGVVVLLRRHASSALMIVLLTGGITLGYAVGQGNVGTIYRHRAQVLPCLLIFAAVGVESRRRKPAIVETTLRGQQPVRLVS